MYILMHVLPVESLPLLRNYALALPGADRG